MDQALHDVACDSVPVLPYRTSATSRLAHVSLLLLCGRLTLRTDDQVMLKYQVGLLCLLVVTGCRSDIVYARGGSLYLLECHNESTQLTDRDSDGGASGAPRWSPDGRWIASRLSRDIEVDPTEPPRDDWQYEIVVMNPRGGDRVSLTSTIDEHAIHATWAPDSDQIAFQVGLELSGPGPVLGNHIWKSSVSGGALSSVPLSEEEGFVDREPAWSPDGERIAFVRLADFSATTAAVMVMDADGGNRRIVHSMPIEAFSSQTAPTWSPDGEHIIFNRLVSNFGPAGTFAAKVDGTVTRRISEDGLNGSTWGTYVWSQDGRYLAYGCWPSLCVLEYDASSDRFMPALRLRGDPTPPGGGGLVFSPGDFSRPRGRLLLFDRRTFLEDQPLQWWDRDGGGISTLPARGLEPQWRPGPLRFCSRFVLGS